MLLSSMQSLTASAVSSMPETDRSVCLFEADRSVCLFEADRSVCLFLFLSF